MKSKILIIDRDQDTINSLNWFFRVVQVETVVITKWPTSLKAFEKEELAAVFVDVELLSVELDNLLEVFADPKEENTPLLFLMFSRTFAPRVLSAQKHKHERSFKKPLRLDEIYHCLFAQKIIEDKPNRNEGPMHKLQQYKKFAAEYKAWLEQFGKLIQNR